MKYVPYAVGWFMFFLFLILSTITPIYMDKKLLIEKEKTKQLEISLKIKEPK